MAAGQYAQHAVNAGLRGLEWFGRNARWTLVAGIFAAMLLQDLGTLLRPALPYFVAMIYALAMIRIDLPATLRNALRPGRVLLTGSVSLGLIVVTPAILNAAALVLGLDEQMRTALVYSHAAPPIASSAGLCLLMGLNAAFALEISILASLLTPVIGPLVVLALLGDAVPLDGWALALRLALIVSGGAIAAMVFRSLFGAGRIDRHRSAFDGVTAIGMLVFLIPIFDGVTDHIIDTPLLTLGVLMLAIIPNFGLQYLIYRGATRVTSHETAGASGIMGGNRNVTLFLASVPESPVFSLYVAMYQFPMYFTPLVMKRLFTRP